MHEVREGDSALIVPLLSVSESFSGKLLCLQAASLALGFPPYARCPDGRIVDSPCRGTCTASRRHPGDWANRDSPQQFTFCGHLWDTAHKVDEFRHGRLIFLGPGNALCLPLQERATCKDHDCVGQAALRCPTPELLVELGQINPDAPAYLP